MSLFRLGVEGVVIVISILLAFGIDAWGEGRQEQQRAQNYEASLLEDARTNLERVEASRGQAENELRAVMKLGAWLKGDGNGTDPDTVLAWLVTSFEIARFTPATQGYDQVVSAGDLGLLSEDVRSAMAAWNEAWFLSSNNQVQSQADRHQTYVPFLVEETSLRRAFSIAFSDSPGGPFGESMFPPAVETLLGARRLDNLLTYRTVFIRDQLRDYDVMRSALQSLVATLQ